MKGDRTDVLMNSDYFDENYYNNTYLIDGKATNCYEHYLNIGWRNGYDPSLKFSTVQYLKANPDVMRANLCPLYHFERNGRSEGRKSFPVRKAVEKENSTNGDNVLFSVWVFSDGKDDLHILKQFLKFGYANLEIVLLGKNLNAQQCKEYNCKCVYDDNFEKLIKKAISVTTGQFLCFSRTKDLWVKDRLSSISNFIKVNACSVVVSECSFVGDLDVVLSLLQKYTKPTNLTSISDFNSTVISHFSCFSLLSNYCVRFELFKSFIFDFAEGYNSFEYCLIKQLEGSKLGYLGDVVSYIHTDTVKLSSNDVDCITENLRRKLSDTLKIRNDELFIGKGTYVDYLSSDIPFSKGFFDKLAFNSVSGLKIVFVSTTNQTARMIGDGSVRYRCYHCAEVLKKKGAFVTVTNSSYFKDHYSTEYDIYIFHRPSPQLLPVFRKLKDLQKILIADYDDLIFGDYFDASSSSIVKNKVKSIEDAEKIFRNNLVSLLFFDNISVSTECLRDVVKKFKPNANVRVIHNFLPSSVLANKINNATSNKDPNLIMYCSGTLSHNDDFKTIEPLMIKLLNTNKDLKFVVFGVLSLSERLKKCNNLFCHPPIDYMSYLKVASSASYTIAPLEISSFNKCKSNVKFLESAYTGATLIASPIYDMVRVSEQGARLLLPESYSDWQYVLNNLNKYDVAQNAELNYQFVNNNCSDDNYMSEFLNFFRGVIV